MIIGYARVSTQDQNLYLQIDALEKAGAERIYKEKITGVKTDRVELAKLLEQLRPGDKVIVYSLSRLGRSTKHLISLIDDFKVRGVEFASLTESLDTSTPSGQLLFAIMAALSQFERDLIVERTRAGLEAARARGRKGGRPKTPKATIDLAIKMYDSKAHTIPEIERATGISKPTLYRYLKQRP